MFLRQVLINLIGNALKFTPQGIVTVLAAVSSKTDSTTRVPFSVNDTGIGIPLEKQRQIFEAFSQADMSISRRYGTTGLGLSISERLVKLMNGRIWLDSEEGVGSTFHFELSFAHALSSANPVARGTGALARRPRVLIADDSSHNLALLKRLLRSWSMDPVAAFGGADALTTFRDYLRRGLKFSFALLDMDMQDCDGLQLLLLGADGLGALSSP
jgi:two-component system, sensor histidine kinase and response regulator